MMFFGLIALLFALAIYFILKQYSYWKRLGIPTDPDTLIPFGCLGSVLKREKCFGVAIYDVYRKTKERFYGIYLLYRPALLVRDVSLVRHVLIQDFGSFHDRGIYVDEENDPMSANLFAMRGKSWRAMRIKLATTFATGKLKEMFGTSEDVSDKMVEHLNTIIPEHVSQQIDIREVIATYVNDVIASTIFGLEINSFENPKNTFRNLINQTAARKNTFLSAFFAMVLFLCPNVVKMLRKIGIRGGFFYTLRDIIKDVIEYREKHNIVRKDMLQLLMQLRNTGKINEDDDNWTTQTTTTADQKKSLSLEHITAQAFIFYLAGQETTAAAASFTIYELAQNSELLIRAQKEVVDTLSQNGGRIGYESLQKMEFLDLCISETIRKYPGLPILNRECTEDYKIPGTDHIIEKGTPIIISLLGIHRDPENFPEPDKYDPERFLETNQNYNPNAYMPFGEGPRICIAQRMGKVNAKLAIVKILQHFNVELMEKREIEFDNFSMLLVPKGGVQVKLTRKFTK